VTLQPGVLIGRDELGRWLIRDLNGEVWRTGNITARQDELLAIAYCRPRTVVSFEPRIERAAIFESNRLRGQVLGR
jgi:hypothetical protein